MNIDMPCTCRLEKLTLSGDEDGNTKIPKGTERQDERGISKVLSGKSGTYQHQECSAWYLVSQREDRERDAMELRKSCSSPLTRTQSSC